MPSGPAFDPYAVLQVVPTAERVPPPTPSFPAIDELVRVAGKHDLRPVGPPLTADQASAIIARISNLHQPA